MCTDGNIAKCIKMYNTGARVVAKAGQSTGFASLTSMGQPLPERPACVEYHAYMKQLSTIPVESRVALRSSDMALLEEQERCRQLVAT